MKKVITDDGSITFYNEKADDHYHSKSGAKEEAVEKYIKALNVQPNKVIFDFCFGLGYNAAASLDVGPQTIYCFENDKEILKQILEIDADFDSYDVIKEFIQTFFNGSTVYEKDGSKLIMVFGDAKDKIKELDQKADYVFFDPFSPSKVPDMWTKEVFQNIKSKMKNNASLATYSFSKKVRKNMQDAGLRVKDGPTIGRHTPSTIAYS